MFHPLNLGLLALDLVATVFALVAAVRLLPLLLPAAGDPEDGERTRSERRRRAAAWQVQVAAVSFVLASLVAVVGAASVFPSLVPGAMCGTGVLEASGDGGARAVLLRVLAAAALLACREFGRLDRRAGAATMPGAAAARAALLAAGLVPVAAWATFDGFARLDTEREVDCCSAVYENVEAASQAGLLHALSPVGWALGAAGAALLVVLGAVLALVGRRRGGLSLLVGGPAFVILGGGWLLRVAVVDLYGVTGHHCAWCLFLAENGRVGYPLLVACAAVGLGGPLAWLVGAVGARVEALQPAAGRRRRSLAVQVLLGLVLFGWFAVRPTLG